MQHYGVLGKLRYKKASDARWEQHLKGTFASMPVTRFNSAAHQDYRAKRLQEGTSNATINREMANCECVPVCREPRAANGSARAEGSYRRRGVAISGAGRLVASCSSDRTLKVWELASGCELRTLKGHSWYVNSVALSADGRIAVSASSDQTLKVWEVDSGLELRTLQGHSPAVYGVALSADGRIAVSASSDQTLEVWEVDSGLEPRALKGHTGPVTAVAVCQKGERAV